MPASVMGIERERVAGAVRRWRQVLAAELPALNQQLGRQGAPALQLDEQAPDRKTGPW